MVNETYAALQIQATATTETKVAAQRAAPCMTERAFLEAMGRWLRCGRNRIATEVLFGRDARPVERSSPCPSTESAAVHSRFRNRIFERFGTVIPRRVDDDVGSEILDGTFNRVVDGDEIEPRSAFVASGNLVFQVRDVARDGRRIRYEYAVAAVLEVEDLGVVPCRMGARERKVVLHVSQRS